MSHKPVTFWLQETMLSRDSRVCSPFMDVWNSILQRGRCWAKRLPVDLHANPQLGMLVCSAY